MILKDSLLRVSLERLSKSNKSRIGTTWNGAKKCMNDDFEYTTDHIVCYEGKDTNMRYVIR